MSFIYLSLLDFSWPDTKLYPRSETGGLHNENLLLIRHDISCLDKYKSIRSILLRYYTVIERIRTLTSSNHLKRTLFILSVPQCPNSAGDHCFAYALELWSARCVTLYTLVGGTDLATFHRSCVPEGWSLYSIPI